MSFKRQQQLPQKQRSKLQGIKKFVNTITIIIIILIIIVFFLIIATAIIMIIIVTISKILLYYCKIIQLDKLYIRDISS